MLRLMVEVDNNSEGIAAMGCGSKNTLLTTSILDSMG